MVHFQSIVRRARDRRMFAAIERPEHRLANFLFERELDLLDDRPHHHPRRFFRPLGDLSLERHQRADELHVRLHVLEHLRLEQQLLEPFALDGVLLDDRDHVFLEIVADVAEPF